MLEKDRQKNFEKLKRQLDFKKELVLQKYLSHEMLTLAKKNEVQEGVKEVGRVN